MCSAVFLTRAWNTLLKTGRCRAPALTEISPHSNPDKIKQSNQLKSGTVHQYQPKKQLHFFLNRLYLSSLAIKGLQLAAPYPSLQGIQKAIKQLKVIVQINLKENVLSFEEQLYVGIELVSLYQLQNRYEKSKHYLDQIQQFFQCERFKYKKIILEPGVVQIIMQMYLYYQGCYYLHHHMTLHAAYCFTHIFEKSHFCILEVCQRSIVNLSRILQAAELQFKHISRVAQYFFKQQSFDIYFLLESPDLSDRLRGQLNIDMKDVMNMVDHAELCQKEEPALGLVNFVFDHFYEKNDRVAMLLYHQYLKEVAKLDFIDSEVKWQCCLHQITLQQNDQKTDTRDWVSSLAQLLKAIASDSKRTFNNSYRAYQRNHLIII